MQMRVTFQSRAMPLRQAMQQQASETAQAQDAISSGKRILRPSDDPIGVRQALLNRAQIAQVEQFLRNIDMGRADLDVADSVTSQIADQISRAKEIALEAADGVMNVQARASAASALDGMIDDLIRAANTSFRGRHLFAGENTLEAPFARDGDTITYTGTDSGVQRRISTGAPLVETTFSGKGILFENRDGNNVVQDGIFKVLLDLRQALEANDVEAVAAALPSLDAEFDRVNAARSTIGVRQERMDREQSRLQDLHLQLQDLQATTEDADVAGAITDLMLRQTALRATLGVTAQTIPVSLMDFLF